VFFINSGSTQDLTTDEAVAQIRGEKGTEVSLFVQRNDKEGTTEELRITITRDAIELPSVIAKLIEENEEKI
jgi:carboxyl-terminal processing protease